MTEGVEFPNCAQLNPPGSSECARCRQRLEHEVHQEWEVASNWARLGAALVDALIAGLIAVAWFNGFRDTFISGSGGAAAVFGTLAIFLLLPGYRGISGLIWRATPGKLLFGLRVIGENGARLPADRVLGREFVFTQFIWVAIVGVAELPLIFVASPLLGIFAFAGLVPTLLTLVWVVRLLTNPYGAGWHGTTNPPAASWYTAWGSPKPRLEYRWNWSRPGCGQESVRGSSMGPYCRSF